MNWIGRFEFHVARGHKTAARWMRTRARSIWLRTRAFPFLSKIWLLDCPVATTIALSGNLLSALRLTSTSSPRRKQCLWKLMGSEKNLSGEQLAWDLQDTFSGTARGRQSHKILISELKASFRTKRRKRSSLRSLGVEFSCCSYVLRRFLKEKNSS